MISGLQQDDDTIDQFYSHYCNLWRQIDALTPTACPVVTAHTLTYTHLCPLHQLHEQTRRMHEFIMRLCLEFEQSRAQLLHSPTAYTLDETFVMVLKGNGAQQKVAWRAGSMKDGIMGFKNYIALTP